MLWLLDYILPDWSIHLILIAGIVVLAVSKFVPLQPQLVPYKVIITMCSWVAISYGLFMEGSVWKDDVWADRVRDAEQKIAEAEAKAAQASGKIKVVYIEKREKIRDNQQQGRQEVKDNATKINAGCVVSRDAINMINKYTNDRSGSTK